MNPTEVPETFSLTDADEAQPEESTSSVKASRRHPVADILNEEKAVIEKRRNKAKPKPAAKPEESKKSPAKAKPKKEKKMPVAAKKPPSKGVEGLRKMQWRVLKSLSDAGSANSSDGMTIEELAKSARISTAVVRRGLGPVSPDSRESHDKREGFRSLLSRGMVKVAEDAERGHVYYLGPLGEKKADAEDLRDLGKPHAKPGSNGGKTPRKGKTKKPKAKK